MRQVDVDLWFLWTEDGTVTVLDYAPSGGEVRAWALAEDVYPDEVRIHQESITVVLTNNANEED